VVEPEACRYDGSARLSYARHVPREGNPSLMKRKLQDNIKRVQQRIADACARCRRDPASVRLVAVTKYASIEAIRTLVELEVRDLGESRVQELCKRAAMVRESMTRRMRDGSCPDRPRWHLIGHLQRNKVKLVLPWVDLIHSVDSLRLAEEIDAEARKIERRIPILLEVNAADDPSKYGVAVAAAAHLAEQLVTLKNVEVRGLMGMAPLTDDERVVRTTFERMRELFDEIIGERVMGPGFKELSLGMSSDFEHAIEFGATFVRIGSALFEGIEVAPQVAAD